MENKNVKSKLVFDPRVARKCIHAGCKVCDIKPNRENPDKTIIVFEVDQDFERIYTEITEEFKKKDEAKNLKEEIEIEFETEVEVEMAD